MDIKPRAWRVSLPPEDRSFLDQPKSAVSAAVLFSAVHDAHATPPHPTGMEWSNTLLDDRPGAGAANAELSARIDDNWDHMWSQLTSTSGMSVPYASDLPNLLSQRRALVEGVIQGRVDLVEAALSQGADPNALVPVRHPNAAPGEDSYVALPVGVAAVMLGQRYAQEARAAGIDTPATRQQQAAYERIASRLLLDGQGRPTIRVGTAPDGTGMAMSFYGWGVSRHNDPSDRDLPTAESRAMAGLTLVRHNEPINLGLANALAKISPDLLADTRLQPQLSGDDLLGEALPAEHALDALAHGRALEQQAGAWRSPISKTRVSPSEQVIKDAATPVPRPYRP